MQIYKGLVDNIINLKIYSVIVVVPVEDLCCTGLSAGADCVQHVFSAASLRSQDCPYSGAELSCLDPRWLHDFPQRPCCQCHLGPGHTCGESLLRLKRFYSTAVIYLDGFKFTQAAVQYGRLLSGGVTTPSDCRTPTFDGVENT